MACQLLLDRGAQIESLTPDFLTHSIYYAP
jgi:hypothetical protein